MTQINRTYSANGEGNRKFGYIVVDLVNDFVTGKFGNSDAERVALRTAETLKNFRSDIIFAMDTHIRGDPEFLVWGEHCLAGTEGSKLYPALEGINGYRVTKRHYDSFYDTDLDGILRARKITDLFISGISTDICVLHTVAGSFYRYYRTFVVGDLCYSADEIAHKNALSSMKKLYGTTIIDSHDIPDIMKNGKQQA